MQRRYAPVGKSKPRRTAMWSDIGGRWRVLIGQRSEHRSHSGILYNRRARLVRRFGLSPFKWRND